MRETPAIENAVTIPVPERAWWLACMQVPKIGPARIKQLLEEFGSLRQAWGAAGGELRAVIPASVLDDFLRVRNELDVEAFYERTTRNGVNITCWADEDYPALLKEVPAPPPLLYYRGQLVETDSTAVAIVGTRKVTAYGREMAYRIAYDLAKAGVTIASGLALGVDGVAHRAALEAGGRTIAVLGSGIDVIYPGRHRDLARKIEEQGAVLTEYPPGTQPDRFNFPPRNRIISGLSRGVVVIEAPERSGALITVDFAAEQGRDAFAVPGPVHAPASAGCHRILREGATLVRSAEDILEDLHIRPIDHNEPEIDQVMLSTDERRLLSVLTSQPQHIDDIAAQLGKTVSEVSGELMMLELQGSVQSGGSGYYSRR